MKKIFFVLFILFFFFSCTNNQTKTNNPDGSINAVDSIYGTYSGQISCDDCEDVILTIKDDSNYLITIHLIGEEKSTESTIKEEGKYTWNADKTIISLDNFDFRFKVENGKLYYLDHSLSSNEDEVLIKK